jgi:hypothetical protein
MAADHGLRSRREVLLLGMLGLALLSSGCGGGPEGGSGGPASSEDEAAQAADRDARQRAYGTKTGNPGKAKPKS